MNACNQLTFELKLTHKNYSDITTFQSTVKTQLLKSKQLDVVQPIYSSPITADVKLMNF